MTRRTLFHLALALMAFYCTAPLLWQLITSLKPDQELTRLPPLLPGRPTLAHYTSLFREHPFGRIILNSAIVASSTTLLSVALGSSCAFGLAKLRVRGSALILGLVLSISMFPPIATVSPLYLIIRFLGLRDTLVGADHHVHNLFPPFFHMDTHQLFPGDPR